MARPPRIPNKLPWDCPTIYFITICTDERLKVLDNPLCWTTCMAVFPRLTRWSLIAALAMPEHIHFLAGPYQRDESPNNLSRWFKRWFNETLHPPWDWQEGCFDHLLRSTESVQKKWEYIRCNPVRAGLVDRPEEWPYQTGFIFQPTALDTSALQNPPIL